ncbi:MAG: TolC family protein, partial [Gammaproteobacteria bacterium]|nr:TolC family protein [Gammaproteobacteria bacterium]
RTAAQFDVLAETARRYLELVGWHSRLPLIEADLAQRERMAEAAHTRFRIGAAPEASALRAEAEVAAAKAAVAAGRVAAEVAARRLALMWGEEQTTALDVTPLPISLPELPEFSKFKNSLPASPDLARFASEARIQDARIRLATAGRVANVDWQLGLRHFADTDDLALVGGFSMPLGVSRRAELEASITRAERSALDLERQSFELQLQAALLDAWAQAGAATERVRAIDTVMLPRLHKAVENAERAYAGGALSYAEWSEIQGALSGAQLAALEARLEWRRAMIEIQRLTAEPVVVSQ